MTQTIAAISVATIAASKIATGISRPSIATLVRVAKIPAAGVKPRYTKDWKAAATDPVRS